MNWQFYTIAIGYMKKKFCEKNISRKKSIFTSFLSLLSIKIIGIKTRHNKSFVNYNDITRIFRFT